MTSNLDREFRDAIAFTLVVYQTKTERFLAALNTADGATIKTADSTKVAEVRAGATCIESVQARRDGE